jgi:hypothetical protein
MCREQLGGRAADPAGRARYDRRLSLEEHHPASPPS